jgi:hypothetical protein
MLDRLRGVFKCLNDLEVDYLVIGGVAAILHGVPRTTARARPATRFATGRARAVTMDFRGVAIPVVSREDLIESKRAAGRPVDLEDARLLSLAPPDPDAANTR